MSYLKLNDDPEYVAIEAQFMTKYGIPIGETLNYAEKIRADDGFDYTIIGPDDQTDLTENQQSRLVDDIIVTP